MERAEEILNKSGVTIEAMHYNSNNAYKVVRNIIEQAQKEAYNQAIDDAVMNAEAKVEVWYDFDTGYYQRGDVIVDRNSILKLKK